MGAVMDGSDVWPRRPTRLADAVVENLADQIIGGAYAPGATLPVEPELSKTYGMSRTTIREALKMLQEKRLVRVRQGLGTTVEPADEWDLLDPVVLAATVRHDGELTVLDQLVDVRRALESQIVGQTAGRATPEQLQAIRELYDRMVEQINTPEIFVGTDLRFHEQIMLASGNRLARAIVRTVHGEALRSERYTGIPTVQSCTRAHEGHAAVLRCLEDGDGEGAAAAMSEHILDGWLRRRPRRAPAAQDTPA